MAKLTDLEGEYFLKSDVQKTYGIGDIDVPLIKENLVVFSDKEIPQLYSDKFTNGGNVKVDFAKDFNVGDIISTAIGLTNAGRNFLEYLSSLSNQDEVKEFLGKIFTESDPSKIRQYAYTLDLYFSLYLLSKMGQKMTLKPV